MPLRIQQKLTSFISSSTAEERDIGNLEAKVYETNNTLIEGSTRRYRVAAGATDVAIDLAGLASIQYMVVRTSAAITLKLNGTDSILIGILPGFTSGYLHLTAPSGGITSLTVSNAGAEAASVQIQLAGEEA